MSIAKKTRIDEDICLNIFKFSNFNFIYFLRSFPPIVEPPSKDAIRNAAGLNRFVYIACAPQAALKNWIDFSRPCSKTLRGAPFILKEAVGVDMFPHTDHQEMVLLFERVSFKKSIDNATQAPQT